MAVYRVELKPRAAEHPGADGAGAMALLREAGLPSITRVTYSRLFFLEGGLTRAEAQGVAQDLLADPVAETATVCGPRDAEAEPMGGGVAFEVHFRPGVMNAVAESTRIELRAEGVAIEAVRTARRYVVTGPVTEQQALEAVRRTLANECIEQVVPGTAGIQPSPRPPEYEFQLRRVPVGDLGEADLEKLSRSAHLFLSLGEMRAIQAHYRGLERDPTDLELETLAQTWSEHCVHKTLKSAMIYRGAPLPTPGGGAAGGCSDRGEEERRYANLLKDTIGRATEELIAAGQGPQCLSVFRDNAGVIAFDDQFGLAFKVETHNHPSAIEPYGGAATGIGGVIRDVIGCGLGARPIANTDVFCVAPSDWPAERLPKGVLHPGRVLRGTVRGVADYGNRMGIPTVNGAVYFDARYLGNPLVYCGCIGLIPRDKVEKAARPGDLVVLIGGRTGRDGIHGATFSSAELTDTHADEFSHAVQIGNAITQKRFLDAILRARDADGGCLYGALTDCGAGGLSSAVGEMAEHIGAIVDLEKVPLKYAGLRYDEIWISEAQERMVLAVPPENLPRILDLLRAEEVEATAIGVFGGEGAGSAPGGSSSAPRLVLRFNGQVVGDLDLDFLHGGLPTHDRLAEWRPDPETAPQQAAQPPAVSSAQDVLDRLRAELSRPTVASKAWIIRQYDHEVQGGSAVKPLAGPGRGPADAAVLRPRLDSWRGVAVGCGLVPHLSDVDPYWMAAASIDEALRNVISVGGDPRQTALLDNFCWGRGDDPRQLGALVRACQACYDAARAYGVPFISGKDSLSNEFALDEADVEPLLRTLRERAALPEPEAMRLRRTLPDLEARVRARRRLAIPGTLLISAISIVPDVRRCVTADLKQGGNHVLLVGALPQVDYSLNAAATVHQAVAELMQRGLVVACHDVAEGGWLTALAEMAIAGDRGVEVAALRPAPYGPFDEICAGYLVETASRDAVLRRLDKEGVPHGDVAVVRADPELRLADRGLEVAALRMAWSGGHAIPGPSRTPPR